MKNLNLIKIAGIVSTIGLVVLCLFQFTSFLREIPDIKLSHALRLLILFVSAFCSIYYVAKTDYGAYPDKKTNETQENNKFNNQ